MNAPTTSNPTQAQPAALDGVFRHAVLADEGGRGERVALELLMTFAAVRASRQARHAAVALRPRPAL